MRVLRVYHAAREAGHAGRDEALRRVGVDVTVVAPRDWPGASAARSDIRTLEVTRPGDVNRHTYRDARAISALARELDVDLVDLHEEPFSSVVRQQLRQLPPRLPVVAYTAQNIDKRWPPPFHRWETSALARLAGIYPCSRQAASVMRGKGFAGEVSVLPLGVSSQNSFAGTQEHGADVFRLGLVGRLVPEKGVVDAVTALLQVRRERHATLTIVGRGPAGVAAQSLAARMGIEEHVTFLPWLPPAELGEVYRQLHVLLVPSRATRTWVEQFGRVVTEGRAAGAVPVAYSSGSLPEVVGDAGLLAPEGDEAALGDAAASLAADGALWKTKRDRGLSTVATWDDVAAEQVAFYKRVLSGTPSNPAGRDAAVAEFGQPAQIAGGGRPFALPYLREDTAVSRRLAAALDAAGRR